MEAETHARILITDDSPSVRLVLARTLGELTAHITQAGNGKEALALALAERFDLIITDIDMPEMDGLELCARLKDDARTRAVPVIMVSSFDREEEIERGFTAGATAYLPKAEARERLLAVARDILAQAAFRRQRTVLVVDDSATIRKVVETGLAGAGFSVICAENGRQALARLAEAPPDLILSDIEMPELNGVELARRVHADPRWRIIPFVAMSSLTERMVMHRMIDSGAVSYITKPFNIDQLTLLVGKLLSDSYLLLLKDRERLDLERELMLTTITSLISALEARDAYTRGHSEAVGDMLHGIALLLGLPEEECRMIGIGGRLHDIGKIGVWDRILLKTDKLTDEEYDVIKRHPRTGATIIGTVPSLTEIVPIVLHHHERFDGKGYPDGLRGTDIPRWARMAAVVDTYHAMTSSRPYRPGMPHAMAMRIIDEVTGTQLCPECVHCFKEWTASSGGLLPRQ